MKKFLMLFSLLFVFLGGIQAQKENKCLVLV